MSKQFLFIVLLTIFSITGHTQGSGSRLADSIAHTRIGTKFSLTGAYSAIDGKVFDFSSIHRKAFLLLGFYGCAPCKKEWSVLLGMARQQKGTDFLYLSFDSEKTLETELAEWNLPRQKIPANVFILQMEQEEISALAVGYPSRYVLDNKGYIRYFGFGSIRESPKAAEKRFRSLLKY